MNRISILAVCCFAWIGYGCGNQSGHTHDDHGHDHAEQAAISHTVWTGKTELFVEFKPLVTGQTTFFAAHFTDMSDFKAIENGSLTVSLIKGGKGIRHTVDAPASPGIFRPALQPKEEGVYQLVFDLQTPKVSDRIVIDSVVVYGSVEEAIAANPEQPEGNEISFLKEQAWKIDFAVQQVKKDTIHQVIHTSGKIEAMQGDEAIVTAKTSGIVLLNSETVLPGNEVKAGQVLFTISGEGMTDDNIQSRFSIAKAEYEKAQTDYNRGKELVKQQIISQKDFDDLQAKYDIAKTNYNNIVANYSNGAQQIKASQDGFIKNLLVSQGQYVRSGTPLGTITKNKRLILQADVSQKYFHELPSIHTAHFKTAYDQVVYDTDDFNGKVLSYGKNAGGTNSFLPVYFEIDNKGQLLPGSFVDVYLKTTPQPNTIIIPASAVMEDYENYYVYVQTAGESFEKRAIKIGVNDGIRVEVLEGVKEGEWVVTTGAYQVKMASMSSTIPAHGHSH